MSGEESYTIGDYIKGILIFVAFVAVVGFVGAAINTYLDDGKPDCSDYADHGLDGSNYCTENQWSR